MPLDRFGESGYGNFVRKFGRITGLTSGQTAVVWDGGNGYDGWLNDIAADNEEDIQVVSSSIDDTFVDGLGGHAGAELIQFTGQGADGIEKTNIIPLNGTTPVLLSSYSPGDYKRQVIYTAQSYGGIKIPTASVKSNVGTLTISSVTSGKILALILPGAARTQMMIWRCPKNKYAEFKKIDIYPIDNQPVVVRLLARSALTLGSWLTVGTVDADSQIGTIKHPFPDYIAPGTDLCLVATAGSNNATVSSQFWIEKKEIRDYEAKLAEELAEAEEA